jgi:hypothetical protein
MTCPKPLRRISLPLLAIATGLLAGTFAQARAAAPAPPVQVEIIGMGLDGFVSYNSPCVLRYRLSNEGPARNVTLAFTRVLTAKPGALTTPLDDIFPGWQGARRSVRLDAGQTVEGEWVLPSYRPPYGPRTAIYLDARDGTGRLLGRARMPDVRESMPFVVLAGSLEDARSLQNVILSRPEGGAYMGPYADAALLTGKPPHLWYEYKPARVVVLGKPWTDLGNEAQLALRRWVSFGGTLVIVPQLCADWGRGGWGDLAADITGGRRYGAGRVYLTPLQAEGRVLAGVDEKALRDWFNMTGLFTWSQAVSPMFENVGTAPLSQHYTMPSTLLLVVFIVVIIALVGPVAHLVLARMRRREWAWLAVPGLSLLLAVGSYGISLSVKGEGVVLEVRHVLWNYPETGEAPVVTYTRMLSSKKMEASLRIRGQQPALGSALFYMSGFSGLGQPLLSILPTSVAVSSVDMQRWSSKDLSAVSAVRSLPLDVTSGEGGIRIVNTSGLSLRDVVVVTPTLRVSAAKRLGPGESAAFAESDQVPLDAFTPPWAVEGGWDGMRAVVSSTYGWEAQQTSANQVAVVAHCSPAGMPEVKMSPAPDRVYESTTCVWKSAAERFFKGGPP